MDVVVIEVFIALSFFLFGGVIAWAGWGIRTPQLPEDFDLFLRTSPSKVEDYLSTASIINDFEAKYGSRRLKRFDDNKVTTPHLYLSAICNNLLREGHNFAINFDAKDTQPFNLSSDAKFSPHYVDLSQWRVRVGSKDRVAHIHGLYFSGSGSMHSFNGLRIHEVVISDGFTGHIWFMNCWIRRLVFETNNSDQRPSVHIDNTWVGYPEFNPRSCGELRMTGGGMCRISCTPSSPTNPDFSNPFTGDVSFFQNPSLRSAGGNVSDDTQLYRNARIHLSELGNVEAEKYIQAFENRMDRPNRGFFIRTISGLYDALSFYGTMPGRTFVWLLGLSVYTTVMLFSIDGAVPAIECKNAIGWHASLCGEGWGARFYRAVSLGMQPLWAPFTFFKQDGAVIASSFGLTVWLSLQSLFSVGMLAVIAIGIRRKFITK